MKKLILFFLFAGALITSSHAQTKLAPGDSTIWNVINFDSTINYIHIDTSAQNLWQIGPPQKTIFNSAYSPPNVIITDTVNNYPTNNHSWFDLYVGNFNFSGMYPDDIFFDFRYKIDSDTLKDGGYITVSWDKGLTWMNIIKDTVCYNFVENSPGNNGVPNLYTDTDTLYNGEYGFSGRTQDWIRASFEWFRLPVKTLNLPDTMILRFNFISDSIPDSREGWMIDDIRLFSIDLGGGIHDLLNNKSITVYPNPAADYITIENKNNLNQHYNLSLKNIQGQELFSDKIETLNTNTIDLAGFANGIYFLRLQNEQENCVRKIVVQH